MSFISIVEFVAECLTFSVKNDYYITFRIVFNHAPDHINDAFDSTGRYFLTVH